MKLATAEAIRKECVAIALAHDDRDAVLRLSKPQIVWNPRLKTSGGRAHYGKQLLELHTRLHKTDAEFRQTVLHECCHFLAPRGSKHGPVWRMWMRRVGAAVKRTHNMDVSEFRSKRRARRPQRTREDLFASIFIL